MRADHRSQRYATAIVSVLRAFADIVNGSYRALFNGLAGASIVRHEHFHATTQRFPVEGIRIDLDDVVDDSAGIRVSRPKYSLPLLVVEGADGTKIEETAERIINKWHDLDASHHTENIILAKNGDGYRVFIFLRDTRKLTPSRQRGAIAAFECGGSIVTSETEFFQNANLETVKLILADVAPETDFPLT
jgi:galactose-1-phosphate uridylyltransferase